MSTENNENIKDEVEETKKVVETPTNPTSGSDTIDEKTAEVDITSTDSASGTDITTEEISEFEEISTDDTAAEETEVPAEVSSLDDRVKTISEEIKNGIYSADTDSVLAGLLSEVLDRDEEALKNADAELAEKNKALKAEIKTLRMDLESGKYAKKKAEYDKAQAKLAKEKAKEAKKPKKEEKPKEEKPKKEKKNKEKVEESEEEEATDALSLAEKRQRNLASEKSPIKTWIINHKVLVGVIGFVFVVAVIMIIKKATAKPDVSFWTINRSIVTNEVGSYSYTVKFTDSQKEHDDLSVILMGCTADSTPEKLNAWFSVSLNTADNVLFSGIIAGDGIWKLDFSKYVTCIKGLNRDFLTDQFNSYSPETYLTIAESDIHLQDAYRRFMLLYQIASNGYWCETETVTFDNCDVFVNCFKNFATYYSTFTSNLEPNGLTAPMLNTEIIYESLQPFVRYLLVENPECKFTGSTRSYEASSGTVPTAEATIQLDLGRYAITVSAYRKGEGSDYSSKCTGETPMTLETYKNYLSGFRQALNIYEPLGIYIYDNTTDDLANRKIMQSVLNDKGFNLDQLAYYTAEKGNSFDGILGLYDVYKHFSVEDTDTTNLVFNTLDYTLTTGIGFKLTCSSIEDSSNIIKCDIEISNPTAKDFIFSASDCEVSSHRGDYVANSETLLKGVYKNFDVSLLGTDYRIPAGSKGTVTLYFPVQVFDLTDTNLMLYKEMLGKVAEEK